MSLVAEVCDVGDPCDYMSGTYDVTCVGTCQNAALSENNPLDLTSALESCGDGVELGDK